MKLSLKPVRASRTEGFQGPYGGSQLVLTLYRIYIFCFQMCNRLPEIMKNGDAGIFPVHYSLNEKMMQPGEVPCQFMMEIDRLAVDLHRLGGRSVT